jgi:hypothetical protein
MEAENYSNKKISFDIKRKDVHNRELGLDIPQDYFSTSKMEVLEKVKIQKKQKLILFVSRKSFLAATASMAALFVLTLYLMKKDVQELQVKESSIVFDVENDQLLTSLFVEESTSDDFIDSFVNKRLISKLD